MKKLLILIFATSTINVSAQCIQFPTCTNTVELCQALTNQSYNGNTCFVGYTDITNSVNWNNWQWLSFNSTSASLNIGQAINMQNGPKKIFCQGYAVNFWNNVSFDGGDTMVVGSGCTAQVTYPISNNSNPSQKNVIVLGSGATLYVGSGMTIYQPGDTIKTVPGNNSNNIYIVACNSVPLPVTIERFNITNEKLAWKVNGDYLVKIQYSSDGQYWQPFHTTYQTEGTKEIKESGFYRLEVNGKYSPTLPFKTKELNPGHQIYYYMGNYYNNTKNLPYYGTSK